MNFSLSSTLFFEGHLKNAHRPRPFVCSVCSKTFDTKEKLEFHVGRYHELKNVETCPRCQQPFRKLKDHLLKCGIDPEQRGKSKCECGKSFIDQGLESYWKEW